MNIEDSGKIWFRGETRPVYAVRIGDLFLAPGLVDGDDIECWVQDGSLCVDLHTPGNYRRTARKFDLKTTPKHSGSLFNGFTKTRHADILAVKWDDDGVNEYIFEGMVYKSEKVGSLESGEFWKRAGL